MISSDGFEQVAEQHPLTIRAALPEEAPILTDIALRSKAVWGYDDEFMAQCREELTVTPKVIQQNLTCVAVRENAVLGFYLLSVDSNADSNVATLAALFIDPAHLRQGIGRMLWEHMLQAAHSRDVRSISIDSDPNAEPFYLSMGAVRVGVTPSGSIPGRVLPLLRVIL